MDFKGLMHTKLSFYTPASTWILMDVLGDRGRQVHLGADSKHLVTFHI